jgi:hypothetical protein
MPPYRRLELPKRGPAGSLREGSRAALCSSNAGRWAAYVEGLPIRFQERGLALFHLAAAVLGLAFLPLDTSSEGWVEWLALVVFLGFVAGSARAAYLLWRQKPHARRWSMGLLIVQLPQVATSTLSYSLIGPVALTATLSTSGDVGMAAEVATRLDFHWRAHVEPSMFGVNLIAATLLWLWVRGANRGARAPTVGGLVTH